MPAGPERPTWPTGLYAIFDWPYPHSLGATSVVAALVEGGAQTVQVRAKSASQQERRALALALAPVCATADVPLIVNDDLELALELGAQCSDGDGGRVGLHLGQTDLAAHPDIDGPSLRRRGLALGVSTHDAEQVRAAQLLEPDYIGFGPIFPTRSKANPDPTVGLSGLAQVRAFSRVPIVAIGGIDRDRVRATLDAGADAIAVISALVAPTVNDIRATTRAFTTSMSRASAR